MSKSIIGHHLGKYAPYLLVFLVSFAIRAIAWKLFGPLFNSKCGDSIEYYIYAEPRYREPFMPVLFLFCFPAIEKKICGVRKLIENINILFKLHYVEKKLILELERRIKNEKLMSELY